MIRINLLAVERERVKKKTITFDKGLKIKIACGLIAVLALAGIGWRYRALGQQSQQIDAEIAAARQETARLQSIIEQVNRFDQQKAQLQDRVNLIEQLRKGQTGPVHMLDQISRSLPQMLWLTEVKQTTADVLIEGRCLQMTSLSDFVANLEASGYFKKSVEIVSSQTENITQPQPMELVKFSIKALVQQATPAAGATAKDTKQGG